MYPKVFFFILFSIISIISIGQSVNEVIKIVENQYYDTAFHQADWEIIKTKARKQYDTSKYKQNISSDMLSKLQDPGLRLLTNQEFSTFFQETTTSAHIGIGLPELFSVDINQLTSKVEVIVPIPDSPADKAGIKAGDIITKVNQKAVDGLSLQAVMTLLRAKKGETVTIEIDRNEESIVFKVKSTDIKPLLFPRYRTIRYKNQKIGLIWIPQFSAGTSIRISQILREFEEKKVELLMLDLRNNPGGLIQEARNTLGLFIGERPIAHIQGITSAINMTHSVGKQRTKLPMYVLINEGTASAAELMAGTMQYYERAKLIGSQTAGKGLIYSFFGLSDTSALVVPVGRIKLLDFRDILTQGITPNEVIESKKAFKLVNNYKKDKVLKKAIIHIVKEII